MAAHGPLVPSRSDEGSRHLHPEARRRIEAEHEHLRTLVSRLHDARDVEELLAAVAELKTDLTDHFATEEGADGLHRAIGDTAPERNRAIEELFEEHREFLVRLARLERQAVACREALVTALENGHRLAASLKEHEARETELFLDAIYTEHGGRE